MTKRIALSVVFLCVGVLLLSACGLPELIPPAHPWVSANNFILLVDQPGGPPRQVGTGSIAGYADHVTAVLALQEPACLAGEPLALTGRIVSADHPMLTLSSKPGERHAIELTAILPSQRAVYTLRLLPFDATLIVRDPCASGFVLNLLARRPPNR